MKKVMVFGTFDNLHPGHVNFLRQAKKLGDFLIVVVARDSTVMKLKHKKPLFSERQRLRHLRHVYSVNKTVLGNLVDKYAAIARFCPDIIALGYDQESFTKDLAKVLKKISPKTKIVRLKPYKHDVYKSSKLRAKVEERRQYKK